jgi:prepilin-type N-terminal cleavage/methylation domain-containing protein
MNKAPVLAAPVSGFTLIEVVLAVAILSVGISQIFGILLRSASVVYHLDNRSIAGLLLQNESQRARDVLINENIETDFLYSKTTGNNPEFNITVRLHELFSGKGLYSANMAIEWAEGSRSMDMHRVLYIKQ